MTEPADDLGLPASLLVRLRAVESRIEWRPGTRAPSRDRRRPLIQTAHLFQEEANVLRTERGRSLEVRVDAGPVGALLLLLEADRRSARPRLASLNAGRDPAFPQGAFVACWGPGDPPPTDGPLDLGRLGDLARYALA